MYIQLSGSQAPASPRDNVCAHKVTVSASTITAEEVRRGGKALLLKAYIVTYGKQKPRSTQYTKDTRETLLDLPE